LSRIRNIVTVTATAGILGGTALLAGLSGATPAGAATVTACVTTRTHTHTSSATGAMSDTQTKKIKCGKDYVKWTVHSARTAKGAVTYARTYRNEYDYPHYWQIENETLTSAKNVVTVKVIRTSA
jgi:hypothetical protein